jgi:antitoxin (DNA-binding transcriptional repressor) of toxin-antitoxin stability system
MPDDTIELDDHPELAALAERLEATARPCRITRHGKTVARIVPSTIPGDPETTEPVDIRGPNWKPDPTGLERAAGGWADMDVEAFKKYIYEAREAGTKRAAPPAF